MSAIIRKRGRILPPQQFADKTRVQSVADPAKIGTVLRYRPFAPMTKRVENNSYLIQWDDGEKIWVNIKTIKEYKMGDTAV